MLVKMIRAIIFVFLQNLISDLISISVSVELIKVHATNSARESLARIVSIHLTQALRNY